MKPEEGMMVPLSDDVTHLHTRRLCLHSPIPADLMDIHEIHADPETNRYNPAGPHATEAQSAGFLEELIRHWRRDGIGYWAVRPGCSSSILGMGGIRRSVLDGQPVFNLYYRFSPRSWGNGFATETAVVAMSIAHQVDPGRPVVAIIHSDNSPSRMVAKRAGLSPIKKTIHNGGERLVYGKR